MLLLEYKSLEPHLITLIFPFEWLNLPAALEQWSVVIDDKLVILPVTNHCHFFADCLYPVVCGLSCYFYRIDRTQSLFLFKFLDVCREFFFSIGISVALLAFLSALLHVNDQGLEQGFRAEKTENTQILICGSLLCFFSSKNPVVLDHSPRPLNFAGKKAVKRRQDAR